MSAEVQKERMRTFYASEAADRSDEAWIREGGSARVPENRASWYFLDRKVSEALALAHASRESRVLEVGSSFGHQTFLLAKHFAHVTAVDLSPESIDLATRRARYWNVPNVTFAVADAEVLEGYADASFDTVLSFSTVRFCPHPEAAIRAMLRVVKPGGRVVVDFPNADCPWYGPVKKAAGIDPHIDDRLFRASEVRALMEGAGLVDVSMKYVLFTSKRVPDALLPAFRLLDAVGERLPGVRGFAGILMAAGTRRAAR